ncbi:DUF5615 family PIN-like protein, partial [Roseofilum sp. BLCC_M154]
MTAAEPINFFTDQDVPDGIGNYLVGRGHNLKRLRDVIATDSPDPIVATTCREAGWVLVTFNWKDFKAIIHREQAIQFNGNAPTHRDLKTLHRLEFGCHHVDGLNMIQIYIDVVERELINATPDVEARVQICKNHIKVFRVGTASIIV